MSTPFSIALYRTGAGLRDIPYDGNTFLCRYPVQFSGFIVNLHSKECTLKVFLNIMIISVFVKLKMKKYRPKAIF
jgi:hypothetical protein